MIQYFGLDPTNFSKAGSQISDGSNFTDARHFRAAKFQIWTIRIICRHECMSYQSLLFAFGELLVLFDRTYDTSIQRQLAIYQFHIEGPTVDTSQFLDS